MAHINFELIGYNLNTGRISYRLSGGNTRQLDVDIDRLNDFAVTNVNWEQRPDLQAEFCDFMRSYIEADMLADRASKNGAPFLDQITGQKLDYTSVLPPA